MTQPRDPIEDWLGADVQLLPPRPGAFERVHRAARRRKAMRAAGTITGAAVVIAASVIAPQLAGALLQHGSEPAKYVTHSARPHPSPSPRHHTPAPHAGPSLTSTTAGPPAANFRPTSVTFIGTSTGAVIGRAGAVAGTTDYGVRWHRVGAPLPNVSQIRFLNTRDGWAFGPGLYATHSGGATWTPILLRGRVVDLAAVGNRAFAVVATGAATVALYSARGTTDTWQAVPGATSSSAEQPGGLQLTGHDGYLLAAGRLLAGPVTGGAWHRVAVSAAVPPCLRGSVSGPALLAPAPDGHVFLACGAQHGALTMYVSTDRGRTWQRVGTVNPAGSPRSLAVAPGSNVLLLATSASLWYSADGASWQSARMPGGVPRGGFAFVGMTTQSQGVAVPADAGLHEIFTTMDGGLTWQPRPIQG